MPFVLGALIGFLQALVWMWRRPGVANYPFQGLAFQTVFGAIVYGSILWLLARMFL
jgi:hypothetical protein